MISDLTATVRAALDQRLQVGRTLAVDAVRAISGDTAPARTEAGAVARASPVTQSQAAQDFSARWPVGSTVMARVNDVGEANRVQAEIEGIPLDLHWRGDEGAPPAVGQSLAFRVLSLKPEIVLQRVPNAMPAGDPQATPDTSTRISADAKMLQASATLAAHGVHDDRTVRFTNPLLAADAPTATASDDPRAATGATLPSALESLAANVRAAADPTLPFAPVVLAGPAWRDQPMELIVRRQTREDGPADPTRVDWCGELVIDLPNIGRVAGHLAWSMQGLRVRLDVDREVGATTLADAAPELAAALGSRSLRVSALSVGHARRAPGVRDE